MRKREELLEEESSALACQKVKNVLKLHSWVQLEEMHRISWPKERMSLAVQGLTLARDTALCAETIHLLPREGNRQ